MKASEFRKLIREEVSKVIQEASATKMNIHKFLMIMRESGLVNKSSGGDINEIGNFLDQFPAKVAAGEQEFAKWVKSTYDTSDLKFDRNVKGLDAKYEEVVKAIVPLLEKLSSAVKMREPMDAYVNYYNEIVKLINGWQNPNSFLQDKRKSSELNATKDAILKWAQSNNIDSQQLASLDGLIVDLLLAFKRSDLASSVMSKYAHR